jgi:hypothetical protein
MFTPFSSIVHLLINRVTTSLPTLPDLPYLSPLLTRPKLLDPSPPRRRSSPPSGLSESPEPTRGTLESELHESPSRRHRLKQLRNNLALFTYRDLDTRVVLCMHDFHTAVDLKNIKSLTLLVSLDLSKLWRLLVASAEAHILQ